MHGGGGVAARVQDDDDEHVSFGSRRNRRERVEQRLVLPVGGDLERVPELSLEVSGERRFRFGALREVVGDRFVHGLRGTGNGRKVFPELSRR